MKARPLTILLTLAMLSLLAAIVLPAVHRLRQEKMLDDFAAPVVETRIYRGQQPPSDYWRFLQQRLGLRTVISLRDPAERDEAVQTEPVELARLGIRYVNIPIKRLSPTDEQLRQFLSIVTDPANQPVLIHCEQGRARTGVMIAIYRIRVQGWPAERAIEEMSHFYTGITLKATNDYLKSLATTRPD